jgi:hypothetical protein
MITKFIQGLRDGLYISKYINFPDPYVYRMLVLDIIGSIAVYVIYNYLLYTDNVILWLLTLTQIAVVNNVVHLSRLQSMIDRLTVNNNIFRSLLKLYLILDMVLYAVYYYIYTLLLHISGISSIVLLPITTVMVYYRVWHYQGGTINRNDIYYITGYSLIWSILLTVCSSYCNVITHGLIWNILDDILVAISLRLEYIPSRQSDKAYTLHSKIRDLAIGRIKLL